jgi:hypothetical protein
MKNPHVRLAYEHNPYDDYKMPVGYKPPVFKVRIVRDTRFPPVSHKLTLPERVKIIEERRRILKEEREHAKSASD